MNNNKQTKVIFMGTPEFAIAPLQVLIEEQFDVIAVVTQPDRPTGRKRIITPTPVKEVALQHGIPVLQPERLRDADAVAEIVALQPDLIVTAAYGQILPASILNVPPYRCINIHASLLPRYRGGAPIQYAIMYGDDKTGVTIMYMAEGLDTGDMISRVEVPIEADDDVGTLFDKLSIAGAELLRDTLPRLLAGEVEPVAQNDEEASYAPNITREDERIDWKRSARDVFNQVRALHPWPIAFTLWNGERLKVWTCKLSSASQASLADAQRDAEPGTVLQCTADGIEVMTGQGTIWLTKIQPAGKRAMDVAEFVKGSDISVGTVLGGDVT